MTRLIAPISRSNRPLIVDWNASVNSISSSAIACRNHVTAWLGNPSRRRVLDDEVDTTIYGTTTTRTKTNPTGAPRPVETATTATIATHTAVTPSRITTLRWRSILRATIAPRPSNAARLNTFDPRTMPVPMLVWPCPDAVIAEVISGESAARATSNPSVASESRNRVANRSNRVTSRKLAQSAKTAAAGKANEANNSEDSISRPEPPQTRLRAPLVERKTRRETKVRRHQSLIGRQRTHPTSSRRRHTECRSLEYPVGRRTLPTRLPGAPGGEVSSKAARLVHLAFDLCEARWLSTTGGISLFQGDEFVAIGRAVRRRQRTISERHHCASTAGTPSK